MTAATLSLRHINRATLARQMLLARIRLTPARAIERLVGLQAQVPRPPFVGLWSRLDGFDRARLAALFEDRTIVRATFLRGTIHVLTAKDFEALRPTIRPALDAAMRGILRERLAGIDLEDLIARARRLLTRTPETFEGLRDAFMLADPKADVRAMGYAIRMLLPLVQVPEPREKWAFPAKARFALADEWLGRAIPDRSMPPDSLILRYLAAYGPATVGDFQAWSGLAGSPVREAFERLRPRLSVFQDARKRELVDLPDAPRPDGDEPAPVRLIPEYDNLIATRADERFIARAHRPRVFLSALRIAATVLVDGFVAGTWKLESTKKGATVTVEPFAAFQPRIRNEVESEAEALARFAEPEARFHEVRVARP